MSNQAFTPLPGLVNDGSILYRIAETLASRFAGVFATETVERYVLESYTALARTSKVKAHVVSRTERFAAERLTALAQSKGLVVREVPEVLFVCVQNSGRSQLAAALMNEHAQGRVHARSAGSSPADVLEPGVVGALSQLGVRLEYEFPKPLTDDVIRAVDVVVTMGCGDSCPSLCRQAIPRLEYRRSCWAHGRTDTRHNS